MPEKPIRPQTSPAKAMAELILDYPDLPEASWSLTREGYLTGTVNTPAELDAYREVIGGFTWGPVRYEHKGEQGVSVHLYGRFRDVDVTILGLFTAAEYDAAQAAKAVAW